MHCTRRLLLGRGGRNRRRFYVSSAAPRHAQGSAWTPPENGFHKRELPDSLTALSSLEGKKLFREALGAGGMEVRIRCIRCILCFLILVLVCFWF